MLLHLLAEFRVDVAGAGTGKLVNVASAFIERMNPEKKIIGEREACLER